MPRLTLLAATVLTLAAPALAHAAVIQSSLAAFQAAAGAAAITTTSSLGTLFGPISSVALPRGTSAGLSGSADTVDQPGVGDAPFANGYTGQVVDSTGNTETLTFSKPLAFFGLTLSPDVGLFGPTPVTIDVKLSDGTSSTLSGSFASGGTQFIGFTGSPETSITITTSSPDFAFGQFLTVPEPASVLLLGTALVPLLRRRR